ncbi:MAG: ArnT family glycosyltransferase [Chthoniobacterales bacterium]
MKFPSLPILLFLLALTALRLWLAASMPISADEATRFLIAAKWDWASFDGPGGVTACIRTASNFLGASPLALRLVGPITLFLGSLGIFALAASWGTRSAANWALLAWNIIPGFNNVLHFSNPAIIGAAWLPLVFFTAWSAWDSEKFYRWMLCGIFLSIALFLSYWNFLVLPSLFLLCLLPHLRRTSGRSTTKLQHHQVKNKPQFNSYSKSIMGLFFASLIGLVGAIGPFYWNINTQWLAFSDFTLQTLLSPTSATHIKNTLREGISVISLLMGLGLGASFLAITYFFRKDSLNRAAFAFAAPFALVCLYLIYHGSFPLAVSLSLTAPLIVAATVAVFDSSRSHLGAIPQPIVHGVTLLCIAFTLLHTSMRVIQSTWSQDEPDWQSLSTRLERALVIHQPVGEAPFFLIADNERSAAALGFWMVTHDATPKGFPPVFLRESQDVANQFGLWHRYDAFIESSVVVDRFFTEQKGVNPYVGRSALYLGTEAPDELPRSIKDGFEKVSPLEKIRIKSPDGGSTAWFLYLCQNYETAPL